MEKRNVEMEKRNVEYFRHKHEITQLEADEGETQHNCFNCDSPISAQTFGCPDCKIFLHQECAQQGLRLKISHPFHPSHLLTLQLYSNIPHKKLHCAACRKLLFGYIFYCKPCKFELCLECAPLRPNIKPMATHHHLLNFFSKLYRSHSCNSCGETCELLVLRCVECDFDLHLRCFYSLPLTIKGECHVDQLTLITDPDLVESDKGHDEYYCDACEELRDPKHPVYYCAECPFVAHIDCVLSEVLSSIIEQPGNDLEVPEKVEIPLVEKCLADITGDETMAREFMATLKTYQVNFEEVPGVVVQEEKIKKLHQSIARQTETVEVMKAKLKALESELQEAEGRSRGKLLELEMFRARGALLKNQSALAARAARAARYGN